MKLFICLFILLSASITFAEEPATLTFTNFNGKCPICQKLNMKSTVSIISCTTTLMATHQYYDEEGHFHYEDPNTTYCDYRCSKGHTFTAISGNIWKTQ